MTMSMKEAAGVVADLYEMEPELYVQDRYETSDGAMCSVRAVAFLTDTLDIQARAFLRPYGVKALDNYAHRKFNKDLHFAAETAHNIDGVDDAIKMLRLAAEGE